MKKNSLIILLIFLLSLISKSKTKTKSKSKSLILIKAENKNLNENLNENKLLNDKVLIKNLKTINNNQTYKIINIYKEKEKEKNKEKQIQFLEEYEIRSRSDLESKIETLIIIKNETIFKNEIEKEINIEINKINKNNSYIRNLESQILSRYDKLYGQAQNINCTEKNCKAPNKCLYGNTFCNCSIEYANFFNKESMLDNKTEKIYCSYERKSQLTAFIISIFFNFGIAQFYIGLSNLGFIKLGISMISILLLPFALFYKKVLLSMLIGLFVCFIISMWGLIDIILFGINFYNDGNEVPLKPW